MTPARLLSSHPVFPTPDIARTADFYTRVLGFRAVEYLDADVYREAGPAQQMEPR